MGRLQIEILTDDPILAELCHKYWEMDEGGSFVFKVKELADEYKVSSRELLGVLMKSCLVKDQLKLCDDCNVAYSYQNRAHYIRDGKIEKNNICSSCNQIRCEREEQVLMEELLRLQNRDPIKISELGYEKAVYLYAYLLKVSDRTKFALITEDIDFTGEMVIDFILKSILVPRTVEDMHFLAYPFISEELLARRWELNRQLGSIESVMEEIEETYLDHSQDTYRETNESLCYEVAIRECIRYLDYKLKKQRFNFNYAEGTRAVMLQGLAHFSVAQMHNLIYQSVKRSIESYQKQNLTKRFAGRLAVGILKQRIEFYLDNDYPVKPFNRLREHPQSILSSVLFDRELDGSDYGFKQNIDNL